MSYQGNPLRYVTRGTDIIGWVFDAAIYHPHCLPYTWKGNHANPTEETIKQAVWRYGRDVLHLDGDDPRWWASDCLPQPIFGSDEEGASICGTCFEPLLEAS